MPGRSNPPKVGRAGDRASLVAADIMSPNAEQTRRIGIAGNHIANAGLVFWASYWTGIPFTHACAVVEQETSGRNTWGHDGDPTHLFWGHAATVTPENWRAYKIERDRQNEFQGADIVQHTSRWWQDQVDMLGGASQVLPALLLTFEVFKRQLNSGMVWLDIFTDYNGSAQYGLEVQERVAVWKERFSAPE